MLNLEGYIDLLAILLWEILVFITSKKNVCETCDQLSSLPNQKLTHWS